MKRKKVTGSVVCFKLKLVENPLGKGFNAVDEEGNLYQIKARIVEDITQSTSFDISDINHRFDYLILYYNKLEQFFASIRVKLRL